MRQWEDREATLRVEQDIFLGGPAARLRRGIGGELLDDVERGDAEVIIEKLDDVLGPFAGEETLLLVGRVLLDASIAATDQLRIRSAA